MQSRHRYLSLILGMIILTGLFAFFVLPTSASGHERDTGYQLVITQQSAITGYGQDANFTAVLSFPLADAPIDPVQFHFIVAGQAYGSSYGPVTYVGQSNGQATFQMNGGLFPTLPIGQYSVSATFFVVKTQTTIQSNTLTHTVDKGDIGGVKCLFSGPAAAPRQTITIFVQFYTNSIDPHIGTYGVSFIGPASVTYPNLTLDSSSNLTMQAPSIKGNYTFQCRFNGTSLYNAVQQPDQPFLVSAGRQPGAIRLYSSPTTIVPGHQAMLYVVVPTTPGLPTPSGTIYFFYNGLSTNLITLGQGGGVSVSITLPGNDPTHLLYITYSGDDTYARETTSFTLTNPPISGQSPPAPTAVVMGGKGNATATATPAGNVIATTVVATSTPQMSTPTSTTENAVVASGTTMSTLPPSTPVGKVGSGSPLPIIALLLLGLGGSAAGIWFVRSRAHPLGVATSINEAPPSFEATETFLSPLDGDIPSCK